MKVSSDSWHYKILMSGDQQKVRHGTSLCAYFWMVVIAMFVWCLAATFVVFAAVAAAACIYFIGYVWYFMIAEGLFGVEFFDIQAIKTSLAIHVLIFVGWLLTGFLRTKAKNKNRKHNHRSLLVEYMRAKKQRICPLIEFEE